MSKAIVPVSRMSVCEFDDLDFEYKKHRVQVFITVHFAPNAVSYLLLLVDGCDTDVLYLCQDTDMSNEWCFFSRTPVRSLSDSDFHNLMKKVVRAYLKKEVV